MLGPIIIVAVLVVLIPVGVFVSGAVLAGVLGHFATKDLEAQYADTEYLQLS